MNDVNSGNAAKVQLSSAEMALVTEPGWILTKNSIMGKAVELLAEVSEGYKVQAAGLVAVFNRAAPDGTVETGRGMREEEGEAGMGAEGCGGEVGEGGGEREEDAAMGDGQPGHRHPGLLSAKISKGENYEGLPYVMLDYPRIFGREDVFAIRTMMWWGHYFSVTLHLKGRYKALFLPVIRERLGVLAGHGFLIGESEEEWRHELAPGNYRPLEMVEDIEALLTERPFLKLSAKCGLDRWNEAGSILQELFRVLVAVLC